MAAFGTTTISQTTTPGICTEKRIKFCLTLILTEIFAALVVPQILTVSGDSVNVTLASSRPM